MIGYIIQGENPAHWHVQCVDDTDLVEYVRRKGDTLYEELYTNLLAVCEDPGGRIVAGFIRGADEYLLGEDNVRTRFDGEAAYV